MITSLKKRVAFATLFLLIFATSLFSNGFIYDGDKGIVIDKTISKLKEIGDEIYQKTGVTTVIVTRKHLTKDEFLALKDKYLKTKPPYIVWIFSKTYMDRKDIGLNQMFNSPDLNDKFDKNSLFSPFSGTFTSVLTVHKSKTDPTSAAFLNGYGDLADMLASSYGIKLKSSIGSGSHVMTNILRIFFYGMILLVLFKFIFMKFKRKA